MSDCTICEGTQWRRVERDGVKRVERCVCWLDTHTQRLLNDARVPPRYAKCDLANFLLYDNEKLVAAVAYAKRFADGFPVVQKGLCLIGPPGIHSQHEVEHEIQRNTRF